MFHAFEYIIWKTSTDSFALDISLVKPGTVVSIILFVVLRSEYNCVKNKVNAILRTDDNGSSNFYFTISSIVLSQVEVGIFYIERQRQFYWIYKYLQLMLYAKQNLL